MGIAHRDVEAARKELAVSRRQMAGLLGLDWAEYLRLESVGVELPLDVRQRIAGLLQARVERLVGGTAAETAGFVWTSRNPLDLILRMAVVTAAIPGGILVAVGGHVVIGALIAAGGLVATPFVGYRVTCGSCGAHVGIVGLVRRSCGQCGNAARRRVGDAG